MPGVWELSLFLGAYFLGAIPFALVVTHFHGVNLREVGSGNTGATNVYRALGFKWAFLVFLLDALKGTLPTYVSMQLFPDQPWLHIGVGAMCIAAHSLSVFAQFKGGKGAATGLGVLLAIHPLTFAILFVIAGILIPTTRYVAPVSMLCSLLAPILLYVFAAPVPYIVLVALISVFIIFRHRANIYRLLSGTENKV